MGSRSQLAPGRREAFVAYRDMSERTFARVARELRKSGSLVRGWASEDGWEERVRAWDAECDRRRREEFLEHGAYVAREQAEDAARLREALMAPARVVVERLERARSEGGDSFEGLDMAAMLRLTATAARAFAQAAQVERQALGLSTDNHANHSGGHLVPWAVERKTTAELEPYLTGHSVA